MPKFASTLVVLATAVFLTLSLTTPAHARTGPASDVRSIPSTARHAPTGQAQGELICRFNTLAYRVHRSSGQASGHAWWENIDCDTNQAVVTVRLQQHVGGSWKYAGSTGKKTVYSGGGSANRAVARADCNASSRTQWRTVVDVDLVGIFDDPFRRYIKTEIPLTCRN